MRVRGLAVSPLGVAAAYAPWLRRLLIDARDRASVRDLARVGVHAEAADIVMTSRAHETALAQRVLDTALGRRAP